MTELNTNTKILIIGLGVMGGGYAAALTERGYSVYCITKDQSDVNYAMERGMIKGGVSYVDEELISSADLVIFAVYPGIFVDWIDKYQHLLKPGAIITDVTGVKSGIVERVQANLRSDVEFISAHPMAGREKSGVEFSNKDVFKGANYIVVPTDKNTKNAISICKKLGEELGFSRISELSIEEHDKMIAFLSQLTHCIAVTLMNANTESGLEKYTGDSFRDLTRIAKINDLMWSELFLLNKDALLTEMDSFIEEFKTFRRMLEENDREGMRSKMRSATARRELFDKPKTN